MQTFLEKDTAMNSGANGLRPSVGLNLHYTLAAWRDESAFDEELSSARKLSGNEEQQATIYLALPPNTTVPPMKLLWNSNRLALDALKTLPAGSQVMFEGKWFSPEEFIPLWTEKVLTMFARSEFIKANTR
jgi:hypothetical protein